MADSYTNAESSTATDPDSPDHAGHDHAVAEGYADPAPDRPRGPVIDGILLEVRERHPDKILHECPAFPDAAGVALAPGDSCDACEHRAPTDTAVGQWVVTTVGTWHKIVAADEAVGHTACGLTYGDDEVGDTRRDDVPDVNACSGCLEAVANADTGDPRAWSDGGIVPDDVDADTLAKRKRASTTTDPNDLPRCPECESQTVTTSGSKAFSRGGTGDYDYRCDACDARLQEADLEDGPADDLSITHADDDRARIAQCRDCDWNRVYRGTDKTDPRRQAQVGAKTHQRGDGEHRVRIRPVAETDGGREIDPERYYVLDQGDGTVTVVAEAPDMETALEAADTAHLQLVASGDALRTVRAEDNRPLRWETEGEQPDIVTDGGAIDNEFDEAERDARSILVENRVEVADGGGAAHEQIRHPDVVIDLVTRQHMYVLGTAAASLPEYYEEEGFDLYNYKTHPFLPVRLDDTVYECVYLSDVDGLHRDADTYDFPAGRLAQATPRGEERSDGGESA